MVLLRNLFKINTSGGIPKFTVHPLQFTIFYSTTSLMHRRLLDYAVLSVNSILGRSLISQLLTANATAPLAELMNTQGLTQSHQASRERDQLTNNS